MNKQASAMVLVLASVIISIMLVGGFTVFMNRTISSISPQSENSLEDFARFVDSQESGLTHERTVEIDVETMFIVFPKNTSNLTVLHRHAQSPFANYIAFTTNEKIPFADSQSRVEPGITPNRYIHDFLLHVNRPTSCPNDKSCLCLIKYSSNLDERPENIPSIGAHVRSTRYAEQYNEQNPPTLMRHIQNPSADAQRYEIKEELKGAAEHCLSINTNIIQVTDMTTKDRFVGYVRHNQEQQRQLLVFMTKRTIGDQDVAVLCTNDPLCWQNIPPTPSDQGQYNPSQEICVFEKKENTITTEQGINVSEEGEITYVKYRIDNVTEDIFGQAKYDVTQIQYSGSIAEHTEVICGEEETAVQGIDEETQKTLDEIGEKVLQKAKELCEKDDECKSKTSAILEDSFEIIQHLNKTDSETIQSFDANLKEQYNVTNDQIMQQLSRFRSTGAQQLNTEVEQFDNTIQGNIAREDKHVVIITNNEQ